MEDPEIKQSEHAGKLVTHKKSKISDSTGMIYLERGLKRDYFFNSLNLGVTKKRPMTTEQAKKILNEFGWCLLDDIREIVSRGQLKIIIEGISEKYGITFEQ